MTRLLFHTAGCDPEPKRRGEAVPPRERSTAFPFYRFRHFSGAVWCDGERTRLEAREVRFQDGRFETDAFEGSLDRGVYDRVAEVMTRSWLSQLDAFLTFFSGFLPPRPKD